jgi:hypothetical protein
MEGALLEHGVTDAIEEAKVERDRKESEPPKAVSSLASVLRSRRPYDSPPPRGPGVETFTSAPSNAMVSTCASAPRLGLHAYGALQRWPTQQRKGHDATPSGSLTLLTEFIAQRLGGLQTRHVRVVVRTVSIEELRTQLLREERHIERTDSNDDNEEKQEKHDATCERYNCGERHT